MKIFAVEKLNVEAGEAVVFDKVLVVGEGAEAKVGTPYVAGTTVEGKVVENGKGKKVIIFKYKAKKDYRKKQGHRQPYTMVKIDEIAVGGKVFAAPAVEEVVEEKAAKVNLKAMKKAELIEYAKENNIEINEKAVKDEIIAAIEAADK